MVCSKKRVKLIHFKDAEYPYRVNYGPVWINPGTDEWVGCHRGTTNPLGTPAGAKLRAMRKRAHAAFDVLWTNRKERSQRYRELAKALNVKEAHIGHSDIEQCKIIISWALQKQLTA